MKKIVKKKLSLSKETITSLASGELSKAGGGILSQIDFSYCYCTDNCPAWH
jgi:hypothetical protein